ncbi:hypothetical protein C8Q80DRAFT_384680 [Daedaleopsis nitida]|nr:hypothetical protein C8Q80DRAFT_384680 [Daedaleopsis nitida]
MSRDQDSVSALLHSLLIIYTFLVTVDDQVSSALHHTLIDQGDHLDNTHSVSFHHLLLCIFFQFILHIPHHEHASACICLLLDVVVVVPLLPLLPPATLSTRSMSPDILSEEQDDRSRQPHSTPGNDSSSGSQGPSLLIEEHNHFVHPQPTQCIERRSHSKRARSKPGKSMSHTKIAALGSTTYRLSTIARSYVPPARRVTANSSPQDIAVVTHLTLEDLNEETGWPWYRRTSSCRDTVDTVWYRTCGPFPVDSPPSHVSPNVGSSHGRRMDSYTTRRQTAIRFYSRINCAPDRRSQLGQTIDNAKVSKPEWSGWFEIAR